MYNTISPSFFFSFFKHPLYLRLRWTYRLNDPMSNCVTYALNISKINPLLQELAPVYIQVKLPLYRN